MAEWGISHGTSSVVCIGKGAVKTFAVTASRIRRPDPA
jgi:hypothetical protein